MNTDPYTQSELAQALETHRDALVAHASSLPEALFLSGTSTAWGPAHHLLHLALTYGRIGHGFTNKDRLPDHATPPRRYADIQGLYQKALAAVPPGALQNTPFTPQLEPDATQRGVIAHYAQASRDLVSAMQSWPEADLDAKAMKHPLMGLVSAREILMFCAYHDTHHLEGLKRLGAA